MIICGLSEGYISIKSWKIRCFDWTVRSRRRERGHNWRIGMRDKLNVMIGFLTVKSNEEIRDVLIPVSPSRYRSDTSASSRKEKEEAYSLKTSSSSHCLIKFGGSSVVDASSNA